MAAARGIRSLTTKMMMPPPPYRPPLRGHVHGGPFPTPTTTASFSSSSSSSQPSSSSEKGSFKQMAKVQAIKAASDVYSILLISGILSYWWIIPKINALRDRVDAVEYNINKVKKQEFERIHIEAERGKAKISEAQSMPSSGARRI